MTAGLFVRPDAETDVRRAAFWYEGKREGLGGEFILELDALYERVLQNPRQFPEIGDGARRALLRRCPYVIYLSRARRRLLLSPCSTSIGDLKPGGSEFERCLSDNSCESSRAQP